MSDVADIFSSQISSKISLYRVGNPFNTGAVITSAGNLSRVANINIPGWALSFVGNDHEGEQAKLSFSLQPEDKILGLGESMGASNKRGRRYRMFAKDQVAYGPDKEALYCSHPFFIVSGQKSFGLFLDFGGEIQFDLGFTREDKGDITVLSQSFDLYYIEGANLSEIHKEYMSLVGSHHLLPKWSFGYQQSRYSYTTSDEVREIASALRGSNIPCDAIYLDIDYLEGFKVFEINKKTFGDLEALSREMKNLGFHLVPIIDPAVKIEPGYHAYESGLKEDIFCKTPDQENFKAAVWPGYCHLPDFFNPRTSKWWQDLYAPLVKMGINAFWNDMNEPALFYSPKSIARVRQLAGLIDGDMNLDADPVDYFLKLISFFHSEEIYKEFSHFQADGKFIPHLTVHNLYGNRMAQCSREALSNLEPEQRHLLVTRSSYLGVHRNAVIWTGDNSSNWEDMIFHMRMMVSCNLVGIYFMGADVGGFAGDASGELVLRWTQLGVFSPFFRNHAQKGTRRQEPWSFSEQTNAAIKSAIRFRYALIPYLYSEFLHSVSSSTPLIKGLFYNYPSYEQSYSCDDQFLVGRSIMAAPIHQANTNARSVFLPQHRWAYWRVKDHDRRSFEVLEPGHHYLECERDEIPLFLAQDRFILLERPGDYVGQNELEELTVLGFVEEYAKQSFIFDDEHSVNLDERNLGRLTIIASKSEEGFKVQVKKDIASSTLKTLKKIKFEIIDIQGNVFEYYHQL